MRLKPGRETKTGNPRFPAAVTDGEAKMKRTLVILASLLAFGAAATVPASADKIIIKRGGHHHGMIGHHHHHGGKTVIIKRGHRHM